jgi:hypothetical protein
MLGFPAMNRIGTLAVVALTAMLLLGTASAHDGRHHAQPDHCICDVANRTNAWCNQCRLGTVAGVRFASPVLYDILDPHGHEVDLTNVPCPVCHAAIVTDAWCESCGIGYCGGRAYVSQLTWLLARGEWVNPAEVTCGFCREHLEDEAGARCESCRHGLVGGYAFADPDLFRQATRERQRLVQALELLPACEYCAAAQFTGGRCPKCNIQYGNERSAARGEHAPKSPSASEGTHHR